MRPLDRSPDVDRFLADRFLYADSSWVGMSSNAMVIKAVTGSEAVPTLPMDQYDLDRCEKTYKLAPRVLRRRMLPTLRLGRRAVAEGGLYCRGCDTFGHSGTIGSYCRACDPEAFASQNAWIDERLERMKTGAS